MRTSVVVESGRFGRLGIAAQDAYHALKLLSSPSIPSPLCTEICLTFTDPHAPVFLPLENTGPGHHVAAGAGDSHEADLLASLGR